jgi:Rod binding domain-containing protein
MKPVAHTVVAQMLQHESQARRAEQPAPAPKRDPKLWKVSQQFEAIFVQQMLEAMHKSVPHSGFLPNGFAEQVHESMFDQAVADDISKVSGLGIASAIYRELAHVGQGQAQAKAPNADIIDNKAATPPGTRGETDGTH